MFFLDNFKINLTKRDIFCLTSSGILFAALFLLRLYKLFFAIFNFNFNVFSVGNFLYIIFSMSQDIFFCLLLLVIFFFAVKKMPDKILLPFQISVCAIYFIIFVYNFVDLLYFKNSTVSLSWENISQLDNILNLWDSGLYYLSPFLIVLFAAGILSFFFLIFFLTGIFHKRFDEINVKKIVLPKKIISAVFIMLLFFSSQYFLVSVDSPAELNSIPLFKLMTSYIYSFEKDGSEKGNKSSSASMTSDNRLLNSFNTPVSITDRKIQSMIKSKLSRIDDRRFNIIYFLSESTYACYYPMYGNKVNASPFLQEASMKSLLFKNMYSTGVRSINSLISILTGINGYPGYKSITYVNPRIKAKSLSEILKEHNYSNALIHGGSFDFYDKLLFLNDRGYDLLVDEKYFRQKYPGIFYNSWGVDDRVIIDEGLKWIDEQTGNGKNFSLTFVPILPHHPYTLPGDSELFIKNPKSLFDNYLNSLYYVDVNFKNLYLGLEKRKLLDDTIIVFLADHGEAFGQHIGNFGHENNIFEENVRIPGIIFNNRLFDRYYEYEGVTTNSDMYATILDILNIKAPEGCQGESVLRFNSGRIAYFASDEKNMDIGLRDGDFKAIYNMNQNKMSLFNIKESDIDIDDISKDHPDLTREYQRLLTEYFKYQKDYIENFDNIIAGLRERGKSSVTTSLMDLKPFFAVQEYHPIRKNKTADDEKQITINGNVYDKGYGVFANSIMKFDIKNSGYKKFTGLAGKIDMWTTRENFLEMQIFIDGKKAFTTGKLNGGDDAVPFDIDIEDAGVIELLVLDAGDNQSFDSAAWINPELVK